MKNHGVVCVHREGDYWGMSSADTHGYRFSSGLKYRNIEEDILRLIADIHKQLGQMEVSTSRVILVDVLPKVDSIFYKLADSFSSPLVVDPARLKLHEKRLGKSFFNMAELAAEAAVTGWKTEILLIETTNVCTFRCLYCPQDIMRRKKMSLPLLTVKRIIEEYACNAIGTLGFHVMGEPTTNPDLAEIVECAAKLHIGHALVTNASILKRETAEDLFRRGLQHIILSVQTFTEEQHNEVKRPSPKYSYETIMRNVKDIILAKWAIAPDARLEIHVMDNSRYRPRGVNIVSNNNEAQRVISFWHDFVREAASELGGDSVSSQSPEKGQFDLSQLGWPLGEYFLAPQVFLNFKKAGHWIQDFTSDSEYIIPAKRGVCGAVTKKFTQHRQMAILSNGDAVMCCFDYNGETVFGNVFKTPMGELDERAESYRGKLVGSDEIPFPICRKCLGFRVKGFDDNFSARKQDEMIMIGQVAIYDTGPESLTMMRRLVNGGLQVSAFVERPNPTWSLSASNESLDGIKTCAFDSVPKEVDAVLFVPGWKYDEAIINKMKNRNPHLLLGQVDLVALDPFRPLPEEFGQGGKLREAQKRGNFLEKEVAKLREEKEELQKKIGGSLFGRIARTLKQK